MVGVGANDRPFLSSCISCGVSVRELRLCIPMSALELVSGPLLKNGRFSVVFLWLAACHLFFVCVPVSGVVVG